MLSSHVGIILHRDIVGLRFVGSKQSLNRFSRSESRKGGTKLRTFCSRIQSEETYQPSYDSRKKLKTVQWPTSRREELESLAKKVHPDATLRKADPGSFSFRVRANENVAPSKVDEIGEPVVGLLKPPPMVQKTDPFVLQQHKKREEQRAALFSILRTQTDTLTINQVNDYYDKLRALDFEELKEGFEPQYFTKAQLVNEGVVASQTPSSAATSHLSHSISSTLGRIGTEEWTLANNALRRKFLEDLLANEKEQTQLAQSMPSTGRRLVPRTNMLAVLNTLTLRRLFGLCMQTLLVAPWAVARGFASATGLAKKETFWQFETKLEEQLFEKRKRALEADLKQKLQDLEDRKQQMKARVGKGVIVGVFLRTFALRWAIFVLKLITWYPFVAAYKLAKYTSVWLYFSVFGTLDSIRRASVATGTLLGGRNGWIASSVATAWHGLAPHTWKRYYLGDPLGTLWDRHTGHSEEVLQKSISAFHRLGYGLERGIFGFFHSNRFVGLLLLFTFALVTAQMLIEPDQNYLQDMEAITRQTTSSPSQ